MLLAEKFAKLTPEQIRELNAIKDEMELDAFVTQTGLELTDDEKAQSMEYIKTGSLPLEDEALDYVAGGRTFHTVVWGDTLSALAVRYKTTVAQIQRWNNIADPNKIYVGQKLRVG